MNALTGDSPFAISINEIKTYLFSYLDALSIFTVLIAYREAK